MRTWILLLRGVNVGGKHVLPMKQLVRDLESLRPKLANIRTYIQSGNVVFGASAQIPASFADRIATRIEQRHGFRPQVLILSAAQLQEAIQANPFPEAVAEPKTLHFFFLANPPAAPDLGAISVIQAPNERFRLIDQVFYLHAPEGLGRSKLAARVEQFLGVPATARNFRTVERLLAMSKVT